MRTPRPFIRGLALAFAMSACGATAEAPVVSVQSSGTTPPMSASSPSPSLPPRAVEPEAEVELDGPSGGLVATDDAIWAATESGIARIDPDTNAIVEVIATEDGVRPFAIGFDSIWVTVYESGELKRYDMSSGSLVGTIDLGDGVLAAGVTVTDDAVWVASHHGGAVLRVDPIDNAVIAEVSVGRAGRSGPYEMITAGSSVWVAVPNLPGVVEVDPASNTAETTIAFTSGGAACGPLSLIRGEIWISSCFDWTTLSVVSVADERERGSVHMNGFGGQAVEVDGTVWIPVTRDDDLEENVLLGIDPTTLEVVDAIELHAFAYPALLAFDALWVNHEEAGSLSRFSLADLGAAEP